MASHHLHHPTTTTCCCSCYNTPSPYPPQPLDPLLQSLPPHLLHTPPPQPHLYSPYSTTHHNPHHHHHHHQPQYHPPQPQPPNTQNFQLHHHHHQNHQQLQTQSTISSLLRRIAALESSLHSQSSAYSLRHAAARTIQTHFRAFLVRRSRTLRHLKHLASFKSTLNSLKSSVSDNIHFNSQALSNKAMDLLLQLDSIQGDDPMIRDGKRSISRELIRFMEFIDGVSVRRNELPSRAMKNVRVVGNGNKSRVLYNHRMGNADCGHMGGHERELEEKLKVVAEKINGISEEEGDDGDVGLENPSFSMDRKIGFAQNRKGIDAKAKKRVSFAENGNVYRVLKTTHRPISSGDVNSSDGSGGSIDGGDDENPSISTNRKMGFTQNRNGVQGKAKKKVSFAENGSVYRVLKSTHEPISSVDMNSSDGSGSIDDVDDERELVDNLCREVEDIGGFDKEIEDDEEGMVDDGGSSTSIDGERIPMRSLEAEGRCGIFGHDHNGRLFISVPLPMKMEKGDLIKKNEAVKTVEEPKHGQGFSFGQLSRKFNAVELSTSRY